MARYASTTTVSVEKSRAEIETILNRYGADCFAYASMPTKAVVGFRAHGRQLRFDLPLPDRNSEQFKWKKVGRSTWNKKERNQEERFQVWEQACRQRWRALALAIKAKLEAVEAGISSFESEFMAHILLPSGQTVGEWMEPQIEHAYDSGQMPPMVLALPAPSDVERKK